MLDTVYNAFAYIQYPELVFLFAAVPFIVINSVAIEFKLI